MTVTASSSHGTVVTTQFDAPVRRRARARWRSVAILTASLAATATLAAVSGALVVSARDVWYENLQRPAWGPSATSFLVAASGSYVLLGLAGWRIWARSPNSLAFTSWLVLLGLHLAWTVLFFGLWVPRWSLIALVPLVAVAGATLIAAGRSTRLGAALLVPDLVWIGYLAALNAAIVAWN
jgi:benzodiazapine receptor